ncbi:MAG: serine/threonine protein kinase [Planctomycetes bacterium]|nr:serine/threonine protein kinase [Planctomycetota bacterium]
MRSEELDGCGDGVLLRRFLDEQLTDGEESRLVDHVGACVSCRTRLEAMAGGADWRSDRRHLIDRAEEALGDTSPGPHPDALLEQALRMLDAADDPAMLGRLGRYEVCGVIGFGSTGVVYKAFDRSLNRYVAIKQLASGYSAAGAARARFAREGRAIAAVRDEHVIAIHGVDESRGVPFIVMQYVPGGSLQRRLDEQGPMTTAEVARVAMQIASGLAAAHRHGIVHRDVKPANVLLEAGVERAVVTDFGLARVADEATVTHTGWITGTPQFMSPEQARGAALDHRTDLFSLGAVMYAMCTGRSPFRSETLLGVLHRVCETEPRPIREINPGIEAWLTGFVDKLLAKAPDARFGSASEVAELLAGELAHLQAPTNVAEPERAWWSRVGSRSLIRGGGRKLAVVVASVVVAATLALWGVLLGLDGGGASVAVPGSIAQSLAAARAAFDEAVELHRVALAAVGPERSEQVQRAIAAHARARQLGYDPGKSAFLIAGLHAATGRPNRAVTALDEAIGAGFDDVVLTQATPEFEALRGDSGFARAVDRMRRLAALRARGRELYFKRRDYARAEPIFREVLAECPQDEYTATLIGAALLLQGKRTESIPWHLRAQHTVRYAAFGHYNMACVAARSSDAATAFVELRIAIDGGFADAEHMRTDPDLEFLRAYPKFADLMQYAAERSKVR